MDGKEALKTISKGAFLVMFGLLISRFFAYVFRLVVAKQGVSEYGIVSLAVAIIGILTIFAFLGLNQGAMFFVSQYSAQKNKEKIKQTIQSILTTTGILGIIFGILLFFTADYIAINFFNEPRLALILKITSLVIPFDTLRTTITCILKGFKKIKYEVYAKSILENLSKVILTFILIALPIPLDIVQKVGIAIVLALAISFIYANYFLRKNYKSFLKNFKFQLVNKKTISYSFPLMLTAALLYFIGWTDTFMIGFLTKSTELVGLYNAAQPTAQLMYTFPYAILALGIPVLTEFITKKQNSEFYKTYRTISKWTLVTTFPLLIFIVFFSKEILNILFGQEYISATLALTILAIGYSLNFILRSTEQALIILKKTKLVFANTVIIAILNILLNIYLIPKYGIVGAAISTAISYILLALIESTESYIFLKKFPFKLIDLKIIIIAFLSLGIPYVIHKSYFTNIWLIIITFILFAIIYTFLFFITKTYNKEDIFILKLIKGRFIK